jgi:hypothetical protein
MGTELLSALVLVFCALCGLAVLLWPERKSERPKDVAADLGYGRDEHGRLNIEVGPR